MNDREHTLQFSLPNGLRCVISQKATWQEAAATLFVKVGRREESPHNEGVSHLIEHLTFRGTYDKPSQSELSKLILMHGGVLNGVTTPEYTAYFVTCLPRHVDNAIQTLLDMALNARLTESDLLLEKKVVINELQMRALDPEYYLENYILSPLVFKDTPLEIHAEQEIANVAALGYAKVRTFASRFYRPQNMVLSVASPHHCIHVQHIITKLLSSSTNTSPSNIFAPLPPRSISLLHLHTHQLAPRRRTVDHQSVHHQPHAAPERELWAALAFPAYGRAQVEAFALNLIGNVLAGAGSMMSRLFNILRNRRGLVYTVRCDYEQYSDTGEFAIYFATKERDQIANILSLIWTELRRLQHHNLSANELEEARTLMLEQLELKITDPSFAAQIQGLSTLFHQRLTLDDMITAYQSVTVADIRHVATRIFKPNHQNLAIYGA